MSMDLDHESGEGCSNLNPSTVPVNMDESSSVPPPQPPTPPSPPKTIGDDKDEYEILQEFNLDDYVFISKDGSEFPALCDPSQSDKASQYYALSDVYNTRRIILEATLPPEKSRYFNNYFGDKMAVNQMIEAIPENTSELLSELLKEMQLNGVTSEMHFNKRIAKERAQEKAQEKAQEERGEEHLNDEDKKEGRKRRRFKGCPKFKIHDWFKMGSDQVNVNVSDIENELLSETEEILPLDLRLAITEIRRFGPIIGEYLCTKDNHMICKQAIYDQTIDATPKYGKDGTTRIEHAVMLIGFGVAKKLSTGEKVPYYVFQNNRGNRENYIGRILTSIVKFGFVPKFADQCDLVDFMAKSGNKSLRLCKSTN